MAVTHAAAVRDALATVVKEAHEAGTAGEATIVLRDDSTNIVIFEVGNTPFGSPSSGIITLGGTPHEAQAADSGEVDNFITRDRDGATVLSGSVTATGMGGDIEVTNTNVAENQDCELTSLTYEAPD